MLLAVELPRAVTVKVEGSDVARRAPPEPRTKGMRQPRIRDAAVRDGRIYASGSAQKDIALRNLGRRTNT